MNREIKFRAWDGKTMCPVAQIEWDSDLDVNRALCAYQIEVEGFADVALEWVVEDEGLVLMQFTGLKDKNGKEIYEGDILPARFGLGNRAVVWDVGACGFELVDGFGDDFTEGEHLLDVSGELDLGYNPWEVVGNIYENPDLIQNSTRTSETGASAEVNDSDYQDSGGKN
jgi:uncharacterized phage protein (TIGR01671 family)